MKSITKIIKSDHSKKKSKQIKTNHMHFVLETIPRKILDSQRNRGVKQSSFRWSREISEEFKEAYTYEELPWERLIQRQRSESVLDRRFQSRESQQFIFGPAKSRREIAESGTRAPLEILPLYGPRIDRNVTSLDRLLRSISLRSIPPRNAESTFPLQLYT